MNARSTAPRNRPRWHRLILVDLLAAYAPWLMLLPVCLAMNAFKFWRGGHTRWWVLFVGPIHSPFMLLGIDVRGVVPPEFPEMCVVFLAHLSLAVFLHRQLYRWLKYVVPAHLFLVSAIPVAQGIWILAHRF